MSESQALFVRLPAPAAERLDHVAQRSGASKREIITRLILGDEMSVGHHDFQPLAEPAVLTLAEAADFLQASEEVVTELAKAGDLPGRMVGGEWRFARAAILAWLAGGDVGGRSGSSRSLRGFGARPPDDPA
ncbi:MAG TPA: helix-turn-helix domain-containing protein [Miltoncostaeaceae bacterium]|nr:helix-turn-helix domain-containing protein [Miltoncostaeaceae bacterium]